MIMIGIKWETPDRLSRAHKKQVLAQCIAIYINLKIIFERTSWEQTLGAILFLCPGYLIDHSMAGPWADCNKGIECPLNIEYIFNKVKAALYFKEWYSVWVALCGEVNNVCAFGDTTVFSKVCTWKGHFFFDVK